MTTSEGQSYALLRSVWSDDRSTFDRVWQWTQNNLHRSEDRLFAWRWGKRQDGNYGILEAGGENSAADADLDIALALIFASYRWHEPQFLEQALPIMADIWQLETEEVAGKRYLLAGKWATSEEEIILNPSYFSPATWRVFAQVDTQHDWLSLIDPAYAVLRDSGQMPLRQQSGIGLPPNWVALNKRTATLQAPSNEQLSTDYSYDAMRIPWRIAVDWWWYQEPQAQAYLGSLMALKQLYQQTGILTGSYQHDGVPLTDYESPAMYATALPYFQLIEPALGQEIYEKKIQSLYSNDQNNFVDDLNYYDQNWLWFSLALYQHNLPNLATQPTITEASENSFIQSSSASSVATEQASEVTVSPLLNSEASQTVEITSQEEENEEVNNAE